MKLIIDINEELYEAYKGKPPMLGDAGMDMIAQAIANGIPVYEHERLHEKLKREWADKVWRLYAEHHSQLLACDIDFNNKLNDLLVKYQQEGEEE